MFAMQLVGGIVEFVVSLERETDQQLAVALERTQCRGDVVVLTRDMPAMPSLSRLILWSKVSAGA